MSQIFLDSAPTRGQAIKFSIAAAVGGSLLCLAGLILTGATTVLIVATPVLILFSPILVPVVAGMIMVTFGFMFSSGCLVAAPTIVAWMHHYVTGKHPLWAEQLLDHLRMMIVGKVGHMKEIENGDKIEKPVEDLDS